MRAMVGVNEKGLRCGEDHQHAILTDAEVELMRTMHEADGWSYSRLAEKFEISKSAVAMICRYERRADVPVRYKAVHVPS